ncbi:S-adenosyl-L-methionine-dependent methyltransferase [Thamnidium elegans]|uniref:Methyltransferase domain-containing protein n=1 Tax=Thamnidium elegans TaxID=101142 RepID=A0A8H7SN70_9FUNG|nr:hypothetical protein INT48_009206 [Thamnidium elegans]KAI8061223.1 S-adenosyl-L-methionine-dependent methyltransferase [Thamnidium elegans]
MGNQPSKDGLVDSTNQKRNRASGKGSSLYKQDYQQLENNRVIGNNGPTKSSSSRLLNRKNNGTNGPVVVSPVRHQFVLTDHVTPLVSLSAASSFNVYQRRSSGRDTRSMSSTSITSEEGEPNTPTYYSNNTRSSYDDFANSFMNEIQLQQKKLSSSLPVKHSDGFIINTTSSTRSSESRMSSRKRDSRDIWVYEYGAEKERDRQTRQHYVLKQVFKGNIHVELNEPARILDSACGVGLWSLETAHDYPKCQIIGIDVVPPSEKEGWNLGTTINNQITHSSAGQNKQSVQFQYGDILKPLLFPDNHFDFIYQRDVATVLPFNLWPILISEFFRITKPGGRIQLVEYDLLFKRPGPVLTKVNEWYRSAASTIGVNPDYTEHLTRYMKEAGFVDIEEQVYDIPIGEWPESDLEKQHGYLYKEQMRALFKSMKKWWCTEIKVSQQEYDLVCSEALEEFEEFCSSARWKIFTCTKPMN